MSANEPGAGCEAARRALGERPAGSHEVPAAAQAHLAGCEACRGAWAAERGEVAAWRAATTHTAALPAFDRVVGAMGERRRAARVQANRWSWGLGAVAVAAALVLALAVPRGAVELPEEGVVLAARAGLVSYARGGAWRAVAVADEATLEAGDALETGSDGAATLARPGVAAVEVAAGTRVVLASWRDADVTMDLERGALTAEVAPRAPGERFVIRTPLARVEVVGTRFVTRHDAVRGTVVEGQSGVVRVYRADGGLVATVRAGERVTVPTAVASVDTAAADPSAGVDAVAGPDAGAAPVAPGVADPAAAPGGVVDPAAAAGAIAAAAPRTAGLASAHAPLADRATSAATANAVAPGSTAASMPERATSAATANAVAPGPTAAPTPERATSAATANAVAPGPTAAPTPERAASAATANAAAPEAAAAPSPVAIARRALAAGRPEDAVAALGPVLARHPSAPAWAALGDAHALAGRPCDAADAYAAAAPAVGDPGALVIALGAAELACGRADRARARWADYLARFPATPTAPAVAARLAEREAARGDEAEAERLWRLTLALAPDGPDGAAALAAVGRRLLARRDYEGATALFAVHAATSRGRLGETALVGLMHSRAGAGRGDEVSALAARYRALWPHGPRRAEVDALDAASGPGGPTSP